MLQLSHSDGPYTQGQIRTKLSAPNPSDISSWLQHSVVNYRRGGCNHHTYIVKTNTFMNVFCRKTCMLAVLWTVKHPMWFSDLSMNLYVFLHRTHHMQTKRRDTHMQYGQGIPTTPWPHNMKQLDIQIPKISSMIDSSVCQLFVSYYMFNSYHCEWKRKWCAHLCVTIWI